MPRYITNDTASPIYVAGRMIPPFDGRHFEDHELPPEHKPQAVVEDAAAPSLDDQLQELRSGSIKEIHPKLEGLTYEALDRLAELEVADNGGRKGLLQAIDEEKLRRADAQLEADQAAQRDAALKGARDALLSARVALDNVPATATEAERAAAVAAVEEAEAKVKALESPED